ncbi:MAG: N-acetyltransferase [Deltaproteobacteria bacterium]|nr:MAG: N-acetyltransferase [Deltaproteobacteria bacterium]
MRHLKRYPAGRTETDGASLRVERVEGRRGMGRFARVPWPVYADDPAWVPPLLMERRQFFSPRNPYFSHARCAFWIAYRGAVPVGRISAQVDALHLERYRDATGFFGMIEAEDDAGTFSALLGTAEDWLREKGMRRVLGPFNLSINQECGLLVDGFDAPPSIMMGHARPYFAHRIEEQGYRREKDLLAYLVEAGFAAPPLMRDLAERATADVRVRSLRKSRFSEDVEILQDIFEDAWSENWGFIPFTRAEFEHMAKDIRLLVDVSFVKIAEVRGRPAAMIVVLPNINEIIRDLDGRLFPLGWLRLLWRLKVKGTASARVPLMGVRKCYHDTLLGPILAFLVIDAVREPAQKSGIREVEMSWILEDNTGMRNIIEAVGGTVYKRYRIYGKDLD